MNLKTRLARLEREHASKSGVNGILPLEVLVAMLDKEERERAAAEALVPPLETLVNMLNEEEREAGEAASGPPLRTGREES